MTISVIGAGYVGLVTAALFSELGNEVHCIDVSHERIEMLKKGKVPFYEPQLDEYLSRNVKAKRLIFSTSYSQSIPKSQAVFICVGTPPSASGEADLTYLFGAVEETAKYLKDYTVVVIKSTFPIGFEDDLEKIVRKHAKVEFEFAACPEFLKEGTAIADAFNPDRIVIGSTNLRAQKILLELHATLPGERIICDMRTAQLIKYASNAFLATKISYANALANICEKTGADVEKVLKGIVADKRIGSAFLRPGIGYGGSCLPKDVMAFIAQANSFDYNFDFLRSVDAINSGQIDKFVAKIRLAVNANDKEAANLEGIKIALLGLAFKPNTDDIRDAPAVKIIQGLINLGADLTLYDPKAMTSAKKIFPNQRYAPDLYTAVEGKDALVITTEWPEFIEMDLGRIKKSLKKPIIIDGRNIYDPTKLKEMGFKYFSVGR